MKIMHCCLAAFYIDGYGYQENVLPKMHKKLGYDVMILASTETFMDNMSIGYVESQCYYNKDGIFVDRVGYSKKIPKKLVHKLRVYENVYDKIEDFCPDIIFLHDVQFLDIYSIRKYKRKNPYVKIYIDGHADFSNSARGIISKYVLHRLIYRHCCKVIEKYAEYFYGTLPARVDFFTEVYGTEKSKTKLLVMGADDEYVQKAKDANIRKIIRKKYNIKDSDFLIVTGGKIDNEKRQTLELMKAVNTFKESNIKLLVFGSIIEDIKDEFNELCDNKNIIYIGWVKAEDTYSYFESSDLIIFPGRHSVLWEQAVGQGKPCVFRRYSGHTHIDIGGNCKFLDSCSKEEIKNTIMECIDDYESMKKNAEEKGMKYFSYYEISKKSIEI